jgi:FRG domain
MEEISIKSFMDLHATAAARATPRTIYRGQTGADWLLIPKLGRVSRELDVECCVAERWVFEEFRNRAVAFVDARVGDTWDWLATAQHHGLPTRLLDWTKNLLVAAYFAVEEPGDGPSVIFAIEASGTIDTSAHGNPLSFQGDIAFYTPRHVTPRLAAQAGCFTVHPQSDTPCNAESLTKYVIAAATREQIRLDLCRYGINRATLFPDLDGIASYLMWDFAARGMNRW